MSITCEIFYGFDMVYTKYKPDLTIDLDPNVKVINSDHEEKRLSGW